MPDECQLCHKSIGTNRADDDVCMPSIRSLKMAATDKVYRDMEKASEERVYLAAEAAGVSPSEIAPGIKITDLRSTKHHGDVAAPPLDPGVLQRLGLKSEQSPFAVNGAEYGGDVQAGAINVNGQIVSGIAPNAGAHARVNFRNVHQQRMQGHLAGGDVISERPALETMQPGYRQRA